jgi:hypothetical protein
MLHVVMQGRTALYYAVMSGNETIVKTFLKSSHCNEPDSLWVGSTFVSTASWRHYCRVHRLQFQSLFCRVLNACCIFIESSCVVFLQGFTPLHLSASQGDLKLVQFLVKFGCSIYCKDKVRSVLCTDFFFKASCICGASKKFRSSAVHYTKSHQRVICLFASVL